MSDRKPFTSAVVLVATLLFGSPSMAEVIRNITYDLADVSVAGDTIIFQTKTYEPFSITTGNETVVLNITFPGTITLVDDDATSAFTRIFGNVSSNGSVFLATSQRFVAFPELVGLEHTEPGFDGGTLNVGNTLSVPAWTGASLSFTTVTLTTVTAIDPTYLPVLFDRLDLQMSADSTSLTAVPLPAAAWLLVTALGAGAAAGRRRPSART